MNIPATDFKIKISPFVVDVVYKNKCSSESDKQRVIFGEWDQEKLTMTISSRHNKNRQQLENTFLHEVIHAFFDSSGLDTFKDENNNVTEEMVCERLATSFQAFLKDNPELFE